VATVEIITTAQRDLVGVTIDGRHYPSATMKSMPLVDNAEACRRGSGRFRFTTDGGETIDVEVTKCIKTRV